jgi:hypothetical protein
MRGVQLTVAGFYAAVVAVMGESSMCCPRTHAPVGIHAPGAAKWEGGAVQAWLLLLEACFVGFGVALVSFLVPFHILCLAAAVVVLAALWMDAHWRRLKAFGLVSILSEETQESLLRM